jgi:molybdenum cofactor cytidylyltransferase
VISAIILAAGFARRFGSTKVLALLDGKPLVRHVVERLAHPAVGERIVVVPTLIGYGDALTGAEARLVVNERAADGMSSSLIAGLTAVDAHAQAILVALGDQPTIAPEVIARLIAEWQRTGMPIVAPSYRGERRHPVLFAKEIFAELRTVSGDQGARELIERRPDRVRLVTVDGEPPSDIDSPQDLAALARRQES